MKITLFIPCYVDLYFPQAGRSALRILQRLGHSVEFRENAICCGQPPFNAGHWDEARLIAAQTMRELAGAEAVVAPSGSCATMFRIFYPELFAETPHAQLANEFSQRCFEFSDFLVNKLRVTELGARFAHKVTYHDGCHGLRELQQQREPRQLLAQVKDLQLLEMSEAATCCGFGGTFAVKFPMISTAMGETKCASAAATGAEYIVSGDSSCLMHLDGLLRRQGSALRTMHLAEVLDCT